MQILLGWKSQGLSEQDASRHWEALLIRWQTRYQKLTEHKLCLFQSRHRTLFLSLLTVPNLFLKWQTFSDTSSYAVAWHGLSHTLLDELAPHERAHMNAAVAARIPQEGTSFLRKLEGRFILALLNRDQNRLQLFINSYGLTPCFYTEGKYGIAIGTRIAPLLDLVGRSSLPQRSVFVQVFAADWCLTNETTFQGVFQADAGQELRLCAQQAHLTKRVYCSPEALLHEGRRLSDQKDYLQLGSDSLNATIRAQFRHSPSALMDLTGGMDSRAIISSAVKQGLHPECAISGVAGSSEVQIAAKVADILKLSLHKLFPDEHYIEDIDNNLRQWILWTEGMIPAHISFAQSAFGLSPKLRKFYARYCQTFCGAGGETGRSMYYKNEMLVQKFSREKMLKQLRLGIYQRFREPVFSEEQFQPLKEALQRCLNEGAALGLHEAHRQMDYFYWRQRASRWGGYMIDMQQLGRHVFAPLCHSQLTAVFFAMNLEEHLTAAWHRRHIARMVPALSSIPFQQDAPLSGIRKQVYDLHPWLFTMAWYLNPNKFFLKRGLPYYNEQKRGRFFHPYLQQLLFTKDAWWPEIVPYETGRRLWDHFIAGTEVQPLWSLVTIELWANTFLKR